MGLTESESQRHRAQHLEAEAWIAIKQAEIQHRNTTLGVAVSTIALVLTGAWWMAGQAAKGEFHPLSERVGKVEATQESMVSRLDRIESKIDRALELIPKNR